MLNQKKEKSELLDFVSSENRNHPSSFRNPVFILLLIVVSGTILLSYSNHFNNDFQFDDSHSIQFNNAIREINIMKFFSDGTTISNLPVNQTYRPFLTTENAIDYKLSEGKGTKVFHIHIFIVFLLVCFLLCVFVKKLLDKIGFSQKNQFWGLFIAALFGLLCANAETVNYIFQRAEIDSALFILAGFIAFLTGGFWRRYQLYLLFPLIGFFAKEMTLVFAPLLLLYLLIFEENVDLLHFYRKNEFSKCLHALKKALPSILITISYYIFYKIMIPPSFTPGGTSKYLYLITEPLVICHYILTFLVPYNLSADSDWTLFSGILDYRAITGILLMACFLYIALKTSKNKDTRLFSFGILWFFISLLPTSSFIAFSEVLNDHRCFIPYLGLSIAFVFGTKYVLEKYFEKYLKQKSVLYILSSFSLLFLLANAYGIHERNKVWKTNLSLWEDVAKKSPKNGRGLMNYGLALMAKGDYVNAEIYYNKALVYTPNYSYLYINLGILKGAMGDPVSAEIHYRKAISCNESVHLSWYYYGRYLKEQNKLFEAKTCLKKCLDLVPEYEDAKLLLMDICHTTQDWELLKATAQSMLENMPNNTLAKYYLDIAMQKKSKDTELEADAMKFPTAEKYLSLSLNYYNEGRYSDCIEASKQSIAIKPNSGAYNNMCVSYIQLKQIDKAIEAAYMALKLDSSNKLAKGNLNWALSLK